jgi:hypothetical protein
VHGHDAHGVADRRARRSFEGVGLARSRLAQGARHARRVRRAALEPAEQLAQEPLEVREPVTAEVARRLAGLEQHDPAQPLDEAVRRLALEGEAQAREVAHRRE